MDKLAGQYTVDTATEKRGNLVAQPQKPQKANEAGMTASRAHSNGFTMSQTIALLAFVAALFGVSVHAISSSSNARFDDINARLDRLEIRIDERFNVIDERFNVIDERFNAIDERFNAIDERFDELDAKVDANTAAIDSLRSESAINSDSSDSS